MGPFIGAGWVHTSSAVTWQGDVCADRRRGVGAPRAAAAFHDSDPQKTRYIKIWGNHDLYGQDNEAALRRLFPGINIYEAALLDGHILLLHGHQADPSCSGAWARVTKFLVGKCWTALQRVFKSSRFGLL